MSHLWEAVLASQKNKHVYLYIVSSGDFSCTQCVQSLQPFVFGSSSDFKGQGIIPIMPSDKRFPGEKIHVVTRYYA